MITKSRDYTNRTVDVMFSTNYEGKLTLKFSNKVVTGIQKLAQRFLQKFFTANGSYIFDGEVGCLFGTNLNILRQSDTGLIINYINTSFSEIEEQLEQERSVYPDENLRSVRIESFDKNKDVVEIKISLTSESGEEYTFILPLSLNPGE